jgi:hypothetical protein
MTEAETIRKTLRDLKDDGSAAMKAMEQGAARAVPAIQKIDPALQQLAERGNNAAGIFGRAGQAMTSFGYQAQDAAVQIQMGTNALTVMAQQGSQFLSVFGPQGTIAATALAVGVVAYQLLAGKDAAEQLNEAAKKSEGVFDAVTGAADRYTASIERQRDALASLALKIAETDAADRQYQLRQAERAGAALQTSLVSIRREAESAISYLPDAAGMERLRQLNEATNRVRVSTGQSSLAIDPGMISLQQAAEEFRRSSPDDIEAIQKMAGALDQVAKSGGDAAKYAKSWLDTLDKGYPNARKAIDELAQNRDLQALLRGQTPLALGSAPDAPGPDADADARVAKSAASAARTAAAKAAREAAAEDKKNLGEVTALIREQNQQYDQYEATQQQIFDNSQKILEGYEEQLALIGRESSLLAANADVRGRELALIKERLRIEKEQKDGAITEEQIAARLKAVGDLYDQNLAFTQRKNSFDELARVGERAFDRIGTAITSAFADGSLKAVDFGNIAKAVFSEVIQAGLRMAVINPILNSVFGGARGTLGGVMGVVGAGADGISSGGVSYFDTASGLFKLSGGTGGSTVGGLVNSFDNWAAGSGLFASASAPTSATAAAGLAGADPNAVAGLASNNGTLFGTASSTIGGAAGVLGGGYGIYSGINRGGVGGAVQTAGGVAGVVGGLGTLAAAGGAVGGGLMAAAPWLAAAGPYGLAAAAVLAIVGSLLPGQKPSDMTGVYRGNLHTNTSEVTGLTGDRFSQENRDLASQVGQQVKTLAEGLQTVTGATAIPFNYEIKAGNRDGIAALYGPGGGTWHEYERNEESIGQLVQDMTQALIDSMKGLASAEVQSVISHSSGTEATLQNLDWFNGTFKQLTAGARGDPLPAFTQQINALVAPIDEAIAKAKSLGLSEAELNTVRQKSIDGLIEQRAQTLISIQQSDELRRETAAGVSPLVQQINGWVRTSSAEVKALNEQLIQLGLSEAERQPLVAGRWQTLDAEYGSLARQRESQIAANSNSLWDRIQAASGQSETLEGALWDQERRANAERLSAASDGVTDMVLLERTLAEERLQIERNYAERSAQIEQEALSQRLDALETLKSQSAILTGFLDSMAVSGPGVSPQNAFLAAQSQYDVALTAARNGGDLSAYTSAAQTLLGTGASYLGTGADGVALQSMVRSTTESLGASLDLPGFIASWEVGMERYMAPNTDALSRLTDRVDALYEELRTTRLRAA